MPISLPVGGLRLLREMVKGTQGLLDGAWRRVMREATRTSSPKEQARLAALAAAPVPALVGDDPERPPRERARLIEPVY